MRLATPLSLTLGLFLALPVSSQEVRFDGGGDSAGRRHASKKKSKDEKKRKKSKGRTIRMPF